MAPQYTTHGGFLPKGPLAPLLAMGFALYTFAGVEFVAVTTGESRSADQIPRAIKLTFAILTSVYLGAIVVLVGVMPWNRAGVTESPFVTVFRERTFPAASHIMTFVILTAALSGANAALYASSRVLFSLARTGWAPAVFGRLNAAGSPRLLCWLPRMGLWWRWYWKDGPRRMRSSRSWARRWWECCCPGWSLWPLTSNSARQLSSSQLAALPMRSPLGAWGSALGFVLILVAVLETGWHSHLTLISGAVYMVVLTAAYFVLKKR